MTKTTFLTLLSDAWPVPLESQHSRRTERCPSLARIVAAAKTRWNPEEEAHGSECEYCGRMVARVWQDYPPSWKEMIRFAAAPELSSNRRAMEIYTGALGHRRYLIARRMADLFARGAALRGQLNNLLDAATLIDASLPIPAAAASHAQVESAPFAIRAEVPGTDILVHVEKNGKDELEVVARGFNAEPGTIVHVDLVGASASFSCDIVLGVSEGGVAGAAAIGPFDGVVHRLGIDCVVAAYIVSTDGA